MMYKETADLLQTSFPFVFQNNTVANQCILFFYFMRFCVTNFNFKQLKVCITAGGCKMDV